MVSSCCRRHDTSQNEVQVEREYKKDYETTTHEQQLMSGMVQGTYKRKNEGIILGVPE